MLLILFFFCLAFSLFVLIFILVFLLVLVLREKWRGIKLVADEENPEGAGGEKHDQNVL